MDLKRLLARNLCWNWAGTAVQMLAGIVVTPMLILQLGEQRYGLWIVLASLTGYFDLCDLGLRGSLGRHLTYYRALGDRAGVNAVASTGLALMLAGAGLVLLCTLLAQVFFFMIVAVPAGQMGDARLALTLVGLNLACVFFFSIFDGVLWSQQRFDLLNLIDIPTTLLRVGLTFAFITGSPSDLALLGGITLALTLGAGSAKLLCSWRLERDLSLRRAFVQAAMAWKLFDYGIWCLLLTVAQTATAKIGALIVGTQLGLALVTPFTVAASLIRYVSTILVTSTGVLTPLATVLHAEENHTQEQRLFLLGGKWCLTLALFFLGLFVFLGQPLILLWVKKPLEPAALLLQVLMLGELLPLSQGVTWNMLLGKSRHRLLALLCIGEGVVVVTLTVLLLHYQLGLLGVALALALPALCCRGIGVLLYGCRLLQVPLRQYLWQSVGPAVAASVLPILSLALLTFWRTPEHWYELLLYAAFYGVVYALSAGVTLLGVQQLRSVLLVPSHVGPRS